MSAPARRVFYGWWVVAGAFLVVLIGYSTFYTLPIFYPAFVQQFGWSRAQVSLGGSLALLVTGLASPLVGSLADRWGARFTMIAGTVLVAVAMISMSLVKHLSHFYAIALVFGLGLAGFSILPAQMLVSQWFVGKRGLATGIVISGMGLGGTAGPPVVAALLAAHGWRATFVWQGAILLLISLPTAVWVLRERPSDAGLEPHGLTRCHPGAIFETGTSLEIRNLSFGEATRTAPFWFLSASTFCAMFAAIAVIQHLVLYLHQLQFDLSAASHLLSAVLLASVLGRVGLGYLSDHLTRRRTLLLAYTSLTAGASLLLLVQSQKGLLAMAVLVGLGYGGSIVLLTLLCVEIFGTRSLGKILGTILISFTAGGALGPVAVGYLSDRLSTGYRSAFVAVAAAAAGALLAGLGVEQIRVHGKAGVPQTPAPPS